MSPVELSLPAGPEDEPDEESAPTLGPSAPGKSPRPGKPTLTLGILPDCPALDGEPAAALDEPASLLAPEGIPALDGEPADELEAELEAELDDDAEELDELDDELDEELDDEEGIEGGCEDDREEGDEEDCDDDGIDGLLLELLELLGGDGLLGELLDALEGLLGEGIDDDELWLCD
jgi:hypothetical protein